MRRHQPDPEIVNQQQGEGAGDASPLSAKLESINQQTQSLSPEALCFAIEICAAPLSFDPIVRRASGGP
jgi:hypothetical protein